MKQSHSLAGATALLLLNAAHPAAAQTPAPSAVAERVVVTGSLIKRIDREVPAPVQVIRRDDILESGASSIEELLQSLSGSSTDAVRDTGATSFNQGTASFDMRGLGSQSTLLLLNGRRVVATPVADPNTGRSTIYNLNSIPLSAVERVEILKDGASALYGSDAMAGVVNIILRKNYTGGELSLSAGANQDGEHRVDTAALAVGVRPGDGPFSLTVALDLRSRKPVLGRDITDSIALTEWQQIGGFFVPASSNAPTGNFFTSLSGGRAGTFLSAGAGCPAANVVGGPGGLPLTPRPFWASSTTWRNGVCMYDVESDSTYEVVGAQDRTGVVARAAYQLSSGAELFTDLLASRTDSRYVDTPHGRGEARTVWANGAAELQEYGGLRLPPGHPDNPRTTTTGLRYRFTDIPRDLTAVIDNLRAVVGVSGDYAGWAFDTALTIHQQDTETIRRNNLTLAGLQAVVADGSYRFDGRVNSPAVIARMTGDSSIIGESTYTAFDLRGSRGLFKLAGGHAEVATGFEIRRESMSVTPDERLDRGEFIGLGSSSASGERNSGAVFAELSLPFAKGWSTQLAVRSEHYQDFGSSTTGKAGFLARVLPVLALRGTAATGFRAPALSQIGAGNVSSFQSTGIDDPLRCPITAADADCATRNIPAAILANRELEPETSRSATLGFVVQPTRDLSLTVDWWTIDRRGEVNRPSVGDVLQDPGRYPNSIVRNPDPDSWLTDPATGVVIPDSGPIDYVIRRFRNYHRSVRSGIDVSVSAAFTLPDGWGRLTFDAESTARTRYDNQPLSDEPADRLLGSDTVPRTQATAGLRWRIGPWRLNAKVRHVDKMGADRGDCEDFVDFGRPDLCQVARWQSLDVGIGYQPSKDFSLRLSIDNLRDRKAPFSFDDDSEFANRYHSFRGRYFKLSADYKFW